MADQMFSLEFDKGYPEMFQYIKLFWISLIFIYMGVRRNRAYFVWACFFGYLLLDDALSYHENFGSALAEWMSWSSALRLRPVDFGEIVYTLSIAAVFFIAIGLTYRKSALDFRQVSHQLLFLIAALAFFGVAVDMVHVMASNIPYVYGLIGMVEDGGEMMVISLILCYSQAQIPLAASFRNTPRHGYVNH
ncbi:hypothetical protein [Leptolyngbya sp. CCNP1308]|uniref:hypothetical protein n=1 Tax=Leptolyngbya sp. CCNP1308 TaxID=3110255 RepID=UPI002B211C2A|nr:hypothetical protein [Leptolyngbya sp. CCNP1308]